MDCYTYLWINLVEIFKFIGQEISNPSVIAALIVTLGVPFFAIRRYSSQQRVSRIQKIYYEESLLALLKHLDMTTNLTTRNHVYFENAINILLDAKRDDATIARLNEIANQIQPPLPDLTSKREFLLILLEKVTLFTNGFLNMIRMLNLLIQLLKQSY